MNSVTHGHKNQYVRLSDKCYSMLLRKQLRLDESLQDVIQRLVDKNTCSLTVMYQNLKLNHRIYVNLELKKKLYEIKTVCGIKKYDEVIWRLVVNGSKK